MLHHSDESTIAARVLVVDDCEPIRRFVCAELARAGSFTRVGQASDGLDAVRQASALQPDVIVLDIGLPKLDGVAAAREIRAIAPRSKIVVLTENSDPELVEEMLLIGARGYLIKSAAASDLSAALSCVMQGGQFLSARLTQELASPL